MIEIDLRQPHIADVDIVAYYPIPKRYTKADHAMALTGTLLPTARPDIDNIAKIVLDALNGIAWSERKI
uniref:Endodeoxyribonuclease RusA n=1 Tax=Myoviridae sp. ctY1522 TaxID=2825124 RepID=A0A8S5TQU7_9CAUD|nr:MAG TPA: Endodeoxyribonuclease RusA [Myoviridae sp. ctY1522]